MAEGSGASRPSARAMREAAKAMYRKGPGTGRAVGGEVPLELEPDVITGLPPGELKDHQPIALIMRRDDGNRMAIGINALLRSIAEAEKILGDEEHLEFMQAEGLPTRPQAVSFEQRHRALVRGIASFGPEIRMTMALVATALDVRLTAIPNQTGANDLKAQARSPRWAALYASLEADLNPHAKAFAQEPGSIYASCGHKKYTEVDGKMRCGEMACSNYVRKALLDTWQGDGGLHDGGTPK
jgi:hypothetical protein